MFGNQIQTLLLLLDLDLFIVFIIVFWRLNPVCIDFLVTASSYTSLGQSTKSKSYASPSDSVKFHALTYEPVRSSLGGYSHM